jgi:hypothetical protein
MLLFYSPVALVVHGRGKPPPIVNLSARTAGSRTAFNGRPVLRAVTALLSGNGTQVMLPRSAAVLLGRCARLLGRCDWLQSGVPRADDYLDALGLYFGCLRHHDA